MSSSSSFRELNGKIAVLNIEDLCKSFHLQCEVFEEYGWFRVPENENARSVVLG